MIKNLNKKQKIILLIILFIIGGAVIYYTYSNEKNTNEEGLQNLQIENNVESEQVIEESEEKQEIIKVHISGAVRQEGVIELPANARIGDAIEKVGGVTENAYMKEVNLALPLEDGVKVYIPTKEEVKQQAIDYEGKEMLKENNQAGNITKETNSKSTKKVNINTADASELDTLPGIGASTANKIIEYRKNNGKFKKKEDLKNVSGIGESKYNKIKDFISI